MKRYESNNDKGYTKDEDFEFEISKWMEDIEEENIEEESIIEENLSLKEEDELLDSISDSLGRQIRGELKSQENQENDNRRRKFPPWFKVTLVTLGTCFGISLLLLLTPFARDILWHSATDYAYGKMNYDDGQNIVADNTSEETGEGTGNEQSVAAPQAELNTTESVDDVKEGITNILLLGEEAIESEGSRGRTDIMMIATMNTKDKSIKLTSLMRDTLVQIQGNKDNKLNAAYEIGGVPLLYETIKLNFGLDLDGYVKVGFDDFEEVINKLGGVPVTLTKSEADYLNSTNYISKPEYRNVKEGYQILNGNQVLGYCRIRYVATGDEQINDFGRTSRQRTVLNAVYEQYKSKSLPELLLLMNDILPLITTDITKDEFNAYLDTTMTLLGSKIQTLRLPADNTYEEGYIRSMSVLIPNLPENSELLHEFIYGSTEEDK